MGEGVVTGKVTGIVVVDDTGSNVKLGVEKADVGTHTADTTDV